jgi:hypothetical protein
MIFGLNFETEQKTKTCWFIFLPIFTAVPQKRNILSFNDFFSFKEEIKLDVNVMYTKNN